MITDRALEIADDLALGTTGTGRQLVGNQIDLGVARDIGNLGGGMPLYLIIQVTTAITGTSSTVSFELSSDETAVIAIDGSASVHAATAAIAEASLVAGYTAVIPLPPEGVAYERFIGLVANVGTANLSAGKINAFITPDIQKWKAYADAL